MYFVPSDPAYPYYVADDIVIAQKSGSFTDGSGPVENSLTNQNASWLINAHDLGDSITGITLKFFQFDLLEGDTLKVYDGETAGDSLLGSYSGTSIPATITSTGDIMLITFATDDIGTSEGFYAEFNAHSAIYCSGVTELTEPSGNIDDGSGSFNYHDNSHCMWLIEPPYANSITISFNQFETEDVYDYVAVFDGNIEVGRFSGHEVPDPIIATSGSVFIAWFTNSNTTSRGWELTYEVDNLDIPENSPVSSLSAFPNPASDRLNIMFKAKTDETVKIRLVSLTGQTAIEEFFGACAGNYHTVLDVKELPDGLYFLELESSSSKLVKKVVIR